MPMVSSTDAGWMSIGVGEEWDGPGAPMTVRLTGEALGDEPGHAGYLRCGEQRVGSLRTQLVGRREGAVEVAAESGTGQRRDLVDDRIRCGRDHCVADGDRVEQVAGVQAVQSGYGNRLPHAQFALQHAEIGEHRQHHLRLLRSRWQTLES